jgi:hypothetical protein
MLVSPFIIAIIFILIPIGLPFLFKIIFKLENFAGYCLGIICSVVTSVSIIVLFIISMIVLAVILSSNGGLDKLINSFNDINELKNVSFWILFSIWAVIALLFLTMFLILFFFIKKLANQEESYTIFMFYAGYILIPAIIWYICCFLLSLELEMLSKQIPQGQGQDATQLIDTVFVLVVEFGGLFLFILLAGTSIMMILHHKEYHCLIIWICAACYFAPVIFYFLGFVTLKAFFFSFLNGASPILSIVLASFLYYKYEGSLVESHGDVEENVEMTA